MRVIETKLHRYEVHGVNSERDEVFQNTVHGGFNVSEFSRLLATYPEKFTQQVLPLEDELLSYITREINLNEAHLLTLPSDRLEVPVFVVRSVEGHILVDGHHRVVARYLRGDRTVSAWIMPEDMIPMIKVSVKKVRKC